MSIVTRAQWVARAPTFVTASTSFRGVAVHWEGPHLGWPWAHSVCFERVRSIQNFHMNTRGWADIGYNLVVCGHGDVFVGRGRDVRNAANGGLRNDNGEFYAICYLGGEGDAFTLEAKDGFNEGAGFLGMPQGAPWQRHSDFVPTSCPGPIIAAWVASGHPRGHPIIVQPQPEEDFLMALTTDEQKALLAMTRATNDEVGKLAIVIRDQTTGLAVQVAAIRAEVAAIKAKIGA
jgi:hypothetical protein